jgi:hypothetical protein
MGKGASKPAPVTAAVAVQKNNNFDINFFVVKSNNTELKVTPSGNITINLDDEMHNKFNFLIRHPKVRNSTVTIKKLKFTVKKGNDAYWPSGNNTELPVIFQKTNNNFEKINSTKNKINEKLSGNQTHVFGTNNYIGITKGTYTVKVKYFSDNNKDKENTYTIIVTDDANKFKATDEPITVITTTKKGASRDSDQDTSCPFKNPNPEPNGMHNYGYTGEVLNTDDQFRVCDWQACRDECNGSKYGERCNAFTYLKNSSGPNCNLYGGDLSQNEKTSENISASMSDNLTESFQNLNNINEEFETQTTVAETSDVPSDDKTYSNLYLGCISKHKVNELINNNPSKEYISIKDCQNECKLINKGLFLIYHSQGHKKYIILNFSDIIDIYSHKVLSNTECSIVSNREDDVTYYFGSNNYTILYRAAPINNNFIGHFNLSVMNNLTIGASIPNNEIPTLPVISNIDEVFNKSKEALVKYNQDKKTKFKYLLISKLSYDEVTNKYSVELKFLNDINIKSVNSHKIHNHYSQFINNTGYYLPREDTCVIYNCQPIKFKINMVKLSQHPVDNSYYMHPNFNMVEKELILSRMSYDSNQIEAYTKNSYLAINREHATNSNDRKNSTIHIRIVNLGTSLKNITDIVKAMPIMTTQPPTTTAAPPKTTLAPIKPTTTKPAIVLPNGQFTDIRETYQNTIEKYEMIQDYNHALSSHHEGFSLCDSVNLTKLLSYLKTNHKTYNDIYTRNTNMVDDVTTTNIAGLVALFHATYLNKLIIKNQEIIDYEIEKGRCDLNLDCRVGNHFYNFNQIFKDVIESHINTSFDPKANPNLVNELRKENINPKTLIDELNNTLKEIAKLFLVNIRFLANIEVTVG